MKRSLFAAVVSALALLATVVPPADAAGDPEVTHVADVCDVPTAPDQDLAEVSFGYNAQALQVGADFCGRMLGPNGDWLITVHLTSFSPEVQITGVLGDVGRYETWSGFRLCAASECQVSGDEPGTAQPSGSRLEDLGFGYVPPDDACWAEPDCVPGPDANRHSPFAYGAWSDLLPGPDKQAVPSSISWYAEVRRRSGPNAFGTVVDRAPQVGTETSQQLPEGRPSEVSVTAGPAPAWQPVGAFRTDAGSLRSGGAALPDRLVGTVGARSRVVLEPSDRSGAWKSSYWQARNATLRAGFVGDGVHAAVVSAPYHAYVRAFVSLDLRDGASLARNQAVDLRGVVRPRSSGDVEILIKRAGTNDAWTVLRRTNLVAGRTDTYYRVPWTPRTAGHYVLVTRWRHGTTADGGVLNGQSAYRRVTVG